MRHPGGMTPLDKTSAALIGAGLPGWHPPAASDDIPLEPRSAFPPGTLVRVQPQLGASWEGTVTGWTGSGTRPLAVVTAEAGGGPTGTGGTWHVFPPFLLGRRVSSCATRRREHPAQGR